jgi:triacylglycerol esterase/lipase EstA (alpha/beta hydrolase family)
MSLAITRMRAKSLAHRLCLLGACCAPAFVAVEARGSDSASGSVTPTAGPPDAPPARRAPSAQEGVFVVKDRPRTCVFKTSGPIRITLPIPRYVGETNADGRLKDPTGMIAAGVIQPTARLEAPIWDMDSRAPEGARFAPEVDEIFINGHRLGVLRGNDQQWEDNNFVVPIEHLRFPTRPGGAPGNNEILIQIDTANPDVNWCTAVEWVALHLKAMAPVVLVHGNNSNPEFFERQGCAAGLREAKIPFVLASKLPTAPTTGSNGELLASELPSIATKAGSRGLHLLAHSKGGLDSRWAIQVISDRRTPLTIYSMSTLSTPHLGTMLADLRHNMERLSNANVAVELVGFPIFAQLVAESVGPDEGLSSLTTAGTAELTRLTRPTAHVAAVYVAADADRNGNKKIDTHANNVEFVDLANENTPLMDMLRSNAERAANVIDILYQSLATVSEVVVRESSKETERGTVSVGRIIATRSGEWNTNDTLVSTRSGLAQVEPPWSAAARLVYTGANGRNHSNVASAAVCTAVAQEIIQIDRQIGGMR